MVNNEKKYDTKQLLSIIDKINLEELKELELQQIIFLINTAKDLKSKGELPNVNLDEKIQAFFDAFKHAFINAKELYIAYDDNIDYPFLDAYGRMLVFSKKEFAENAKDYFQQQLITIKIKSLKFREILGEFSQMYRLGIRTALVDNGEYYMEINRNDIIDRPDRNNTAEEDIPEANPELQYTMIRFFEKLKSKNSYEDKDNDLVILQENMIEQILNAKYILPIYNNSDGNKVETMEVNSETLVPILIDRNGKEWIPVFTDWTECEKAYSSYNAVAISYNDLVNTSYIKEGFIINCNGVNLKVDKKYQKIINRIGELKKVEKEMEWELKGDNPYQLEMFSQRLNTSTCDCNDTVSKNVIDHITYVVYNFQLGNGYVFFDGKFAYKTEINDNFKKDLESKSMAGIKEYWKRYGMDSYVNEVSND